MWSYKKDWRSFTNGLMNVNWNVSSISCGPTYSFDRFDRHFICYSPKLLDWPNWVEAYQCHLSQFYLFCLLFIPWNFRYSNTTMTHSTLKTWHGFTIFPNERTFAKMIHRSFVRHSMLRLRLYCSSERASSFCLVLVCAWCSYTYVTFSLTAAAREPTAFQGSQTGEGDSGQG